MSDTTDGVLDALRDAPETFWEFVSGPQQFILATVIGALVTVWFNVLEFALNTANLLVDTLMKSFFGPLQEAGSAFMVIFDMWAELGTIAGELTANLGLFAPAGTLIVWMFGVAMNVVVIYAGLRILDTYVPIASIPVVGRWIR